MKKIVFTFFLLPFFGFSQVKIPVSPNLRDEKGLRTGHWTILCDSSFKETHNLDSARYFRQALFKDGKPVGILRDYYLSGRKQWEGVLLDIFPDVFDGAYNQYHENGQLYCDVNYTNNKQNGYKKVYFPNGNLEYECNMINDSIDGKYIQYYENGNKLYELSYKKNKIDGLYISYYPDGSVETKSYYTDHLSNGSYTKFHANGKVATIGYYKMGQFIDNWIFYYENGNKQTEGKYLVTGEKDGLWKYYNEDGVQNGLRAFTKGKQNGWSIDYYPDKKLQNKGKYIMDERDSIWNYYFPSGKLKKRGGYVKDSAEGKWEYFYESGKLDEVGYFKDNKYDSVWTLYFESGKIKGYSRYKNSKIHGFCSKYFENGKIDFEINYKDGEYDGKYLSYHANGNLHIKGTYANGFKHDYYQKYYENGNMEEEGEYINGEKNGIHKEYHQNGQLAKEVAYRNGVKDGPYKKFYSNGVQETDGNYKNDLAIGIFTYRHETGGVYSKGKYENDLQEGPWIWYHETGELKNQETYQKGKFFGEYICYYRNGKVKFRGISKNGQKDGPYVDFDSLGTKTSEGNYKNGKQEGVWKDYYSKDGKIKSYIKYEDGLLNGYRKDYYENTGTLKFEGLYAKGMQVGRWKEYFDTTGTLKTDYGFQNDKFHGKFTYFTRAKAVSSYKYYINGFEENADNISDSITTLRNIQDYTNALTATSWMERIIKRDFKEPEKQTGAIYQYANIYYEIKNYQEAIKWWTLYKDQTKKYYGDSVNNYAVALSGIALNLTALKKYDESLKVHDEALVAFEKAVGRFSDNYLIVLSNKTRVYYDLKNYAKKEEILLSELETRKKYFPKEPIEVWKVEKYLAGFYYDIEKYKESIQYYENIKNGVFNEYMKSDEDQALEDKINELSKKGVDPSKLYELALKEIEDPNYELSKKTHISKLKKEDFIPTAKSYPFYRQAHKGLVDCYTEQEEYRKAIAEITDFLSISKPWSFVTAFEKAESYNDLARMYRKLGVNDTSLSYFEQVLEYAKANNWNDNDIVKEANIGVANIYLDQSNYEKAIVHYAKVKSYYEAIGYSGTNAYANVIKSYGYCLYKLDSKNAPNALAFYLRSIQIKKDLYGETNGSYLELAMKTAEVYTWNFKYHQADSMLHALSKPILETYGKDHYLYIYYLEYISASLFAQSKFTEAIPYYEKLCDHYKNQAKGQETYGVYLSQISTCYSITGDKSKSKTYLQNAIEVHKKAVGVDNENYLIYRNLYASMKDDDNLIAEAEKIYKELVLDYARIFGAQSPKYAKSLRDLGLFYFNNYDYEKALIAYRKSKEVLVLKKDNTSDDYIYTMLDLGNCEENLKQFVEAEKSTFEALKLIENRYGKNSVKYAYGLKRVASIYLSQKLYDKSLKTSLNAVSLIRQIYGSEAKEVADYQKQLANIYSQMDKNKEAEELYLQNIAIYETIVGKKNNYYLNSLNDLYQFYLSFGQYTEAERIVNEDIAISKQINEKDKLVYANKLTKKVGLLISWKKFAQADSLLRQILKIRLGELAENDPNVIYTRNQIGVCALSLNQIDEAEKQFQFCIEQLELKKETQTSSYATFTFNLSVVNLSKNKFELAEKQLKTAFEIYNKTYKPGSIDEINILDNAAALYQAWGKNDIAEKYWIEVTGKLLKYIQTNFYFLSDLEKTQFWLKNKDAFESFNTFALLRSAQNPQILGSMYNYQLATKAILLSSSNKIKKRIFSSPDSSIIQNYYHWVNLKEALSNAYILTEDERKVKKINLSALETQANKLEKSLNITSEEVSAEDQTKTVTWKDIQKTLTPDEAVVEIVRMRYFNKKLTDSVVYAALILTSETKLNPQMVIMPNGLKMEKGFLSYYKNSIALKQDDENSFRAYWAAIHDKIKSKSQLYISLDGVYNSINLQSILLPNGKYLLEEKNIKIVSNSKDVLGFKTILNQRTSRPTAVLFGFPKYFIGKSNATKGTERGLEDIDRSGISELPGTKTEIEKVNAILKETNWDSKNYLAEEASETAIKSIRNPRILHIATHGFFVEPSQNNEFKGKGMQVFAQQQNPLFRSGLLLSGAANYIQSKTTFSDENGVLTAYEAANLNLENTDLVILSACETGKGEISNGEGVYGLQRAFQTAGSKAVVMSLWKVNDTATQELMTSFYQMWMGGMEKQKAFKSAQLQLKDKYKSPYFWGAFVMVGN